jgi:hypothetical protein
MAIRARVIDQLRGPVAVIAQRANRGDAPLREKVVHIGF